MEEESVSDFKLDAILENEDMEVTHIEEESCVFMEESDDDAIICENFDDEDENVIPSIVNERTDVALGDFVFWDESEEIDELDKTRPISSVVRKNEESIAEDNKLKSGIRYGTVKWFNDKKGFGFISDEYGNERFKKIVTMCQRTKHYLPRIISRIFRILTPQQ